MEVDLVLTTGEVMELLTHRAGAEAERECLLRLAHEGE
jgi:hypothetical protein